MVKLGFVYFRLLLTKYIECNIMYYRKERIKNDNFAEIK